MRYPVRRWGTAVILAALLALGIGGFFVGREARDSGSASAQPGNATPVTDPPGADVTPVPGATPDFTQDWWGIPWLNQENQRPRYDQVLAGIALGPNVEPEYVCTLDPVLRAPARGSPLAIEPSFVPSGAVRSDGFDQVWGCDGEPAAASKSWRIPTDNEDMERVKRGEKSFFEARHGGSFEVFRVTEKKAGFQSTFPSERFHEATIAGRPAVIGPPLFEDGWGEFEVYVWDEAAHVLTIVRGNDLPLPDLLPLVEGLFAT